MDQSLFLSLSLRLRKSVNRSLLSISLHSRHLLDRSLLDPLYSSIRKPLIRNHLTNGFILGNDLSRFKDLTILTPNDHKYPQFRWPRMASKTISFVITGPIASFWYLIYLNLKISEFRPKMTPTKFRVEWPREPFFRNHATKSFWYIIPNMICLSMKLLVFWLQMTPKKPKVGATPTFHYVWRKFQAKTR